MGPAIEATWFDGRDARGRPVRVQVDGDTLRFTDGAGDVHGRPLRSVRWPERTRHGQRLAHLDDGGALLFADAAAFDAWRQAQGHRDGWVVRVQQHWRATLVALALLLGVVAGGYAGGIPWLAARVAALVPAEVEASIGDRALAQLRDGLLGPSKTPPQVQAQWQRRLDDALRQAYPDGAAAWRLHVAAGGPLGANALALPGGHIVVTDELLALLAGADDAVIGVLAHEHGHVRRRHGVQALAQAALVSVAASALWGDVGGLLAGVPALLAQLGYSRDAEREADADAAFVLQASGRDPAAMAVLFERLRARATSGADGPPIAFASHPADAERVRFFREAARQRVRPPPVR